jgi:hypothetical protein
LVRSVCLARVAAPWIVVLALAACRQDSPRPPAAEREVREVNATVRRFPLDSSRFVLVPDDSTSIAYLADDLPVPFRSEGLRVVFSGRVRPRAGRPADFVTPVTLTTIRRRDATQPRAS